MSQTQRHNELAADHSAPASPASTGKPCDTHGVTGVHLAGALDTPSRAEQALAVGRLTISSKRRGSTHVLAVAGELDLAHAHIVETELLAIEATDTTKIILDLSGLDFIDSTGLRMIFTAGARSRADGDRLRLLRGPPHVHRIFEITATTGRLPFAES